MSPSRTFRHLVTAGLACCAAVVLLSCTDSGNDRNDPGSPFGGGALAPLDVDCLVGTDTVLAGSAAVPVFGRVTRGNLPVSGATVTAASTRGLVQPSQTLSDAEGMATVQFTPPGTAGDARIDLNASDRTVGDAAVASCIVHVVEARDPRLNVQLLVPENAAGLSLRVMYDPARVALTAGGARPAGVFANGGCAPLANDNTFGLVTLAIACATLQGPAGTVATFDFQHLTGPELRTSDFSVSCLAYDEAGREQAAACSTSITQL